MVEAPNIANLSLTEVQEEMVCRLMDWREAEDRLRGKLDKIVREIWLHDPAGASLPALSSDAAKYEQFIVLTKWDLILKTHLASSDKDPARWLLLLARLDRIRKGGPSSSAVAFDQLRTLCERQLGWRYESANTGLNPRPPLSRRARVNQAGPAPRTDDVVENDEDLLVINKSPEDSPSRYDKEERARSRSRVGVNRRRRTRAKKAAIPETSPPQ